MEMWKEVLKAFAEKAGYAVDGVVFLRVIILIILR